MLNEEPTRYLFAFRAFLFSEQVKTRDPQVELLIEEIDRELSRRRKNMAGPVR